MKWAFWLGWRFLKNPRGRWSSTSVMAFLGIAIGVASLVVAMAVMSGFERTLQEAVVDATGDLVVIQRGMEFSRWGEIERELKRVAPNVKAVTPYLVLESVGTHAETLSGVAVQGLPPGQFDKVLDLKSRLIEGKLQFSSDGDIHDAAIGRGLAKKLSLGVGDVFRVVYPQPHPYDSQKMNRKLLTLKVTGILSLGKYEYDERYILTNIEALQSLIGNDDAFTGLMVKLNDSSEARATSGKLIEALGRGYYIRDWREINEYLFRAVEVEKWILFCVLLVIVLAAAVNVAITINVNVIQRYSDIAVLKAIGVSDALIWRILSLQGVLVGLVGVIAGFFMGWVLCYVVEWLQNSLIQLPQETYTIDRIYVVIRWEDFTAIALATLVICFISAAFPALRGARLRPVEGLRYE